MNQFGLPPYIPETSADDSVVEAIRRHAQRVRTALERSRDESPLPTMRDFPTQCCDLTCNLLRLYLLDHSDIWDIVKWTGKLCDQSHVWLVTNGVIVDITADQFNADLSPVIVCRQSNWHDAWKGQSASIPFDLEMERSLRWCAAAAYDLMLKNLPPLNCRPDQI